MLRAQRALLWGRAQAPAPALACGPTARAAAGPPCALRPGNGLLLQAARAYADKKPVTQSSQMDDLPSSMLLKEYQNVPGIDGVDDVVKRLLSLEMANQREKMKIKTEQLLNQITANPEDTTSLEARVVRLTVRIRNYEEHMQKHHKDKAHKRLLLMAIDQRKKVLKKLRQTNFEVFEKTCQELGIEYTFSPLYYRPAHRWWLAKKEFCIKVFQETQKLKKLKKQEEALKREEIKRLESQDTSVS
ncbi:28S ribosomal protein S15, mitochondrial-like [Trichosurus vulpecula]|uniref:28S ribosomal protein S15, mitochondrial-like n=1 Tax=Trichosurus vulpecula TaxID=9337 RepID=UPI00186B38AF|nr:28S ribosomal protein S15, mitochondrial-like [Trichosurus vulpecula]